MTQAVYAKSASSHLERSRTADARTQAFFHPAHIHDRHPLARRHERRHAAELRRARLADRR